MEEESIYVNLPKATDRPPTTKAPSIPVPHPRSPPGASFPAGSNQSSPKALPRSMVSSQTPPQTGPRFTSEVGPQPPPAPGPRSNSPKPTTYQLPPATSPRFAPVGASAAPPLPDSAPPVGGNLYVPEPCKGVGQDGSVQKLQRGIVVTVYSLKKKPERMHLMALPDISILQCVRSLKDPPEISVDLARVQEIRCGRRCFDFEKWPEEANKEDSSLCLTIFYGIQSVPQSLSIAARQDFNVLLSALRTMVDYAQNQTYQAQRQRWFRRQFHSIVKSMPGRHNDDKVSIKQLRGWLLRNSLKVSKKVILPIISQLCLGDSLRYGGFVSLVTELIRVPSVKKRMKQYVIVKDGVQCVTTGTFLKFLKQEQNEGTLTEADAKAMLEQYWEGSTRISNAAMDLTEFEDYLFSPFNSLWNPDCNQVHQDMTQPLTDYWIASSHNTYLVGNQLKGQSSEEMYARCLRMGCRCLELDCWDGNDGEPVITHGFTLTSKIRAADVLKVIKDNAWQTSEYPVVLSIENHLSLPQQRYLASLLHDIFGSDLLTEPVDPRESMMPSPEQLKRKIMIKDRKLKADPFSSDTDDTSGKKDGGKTGTLKMKDPEDQKWYPVTFGIADTAIFFTSDRRDEDEDEAEEDIDYDEYFNEYDSDEDEDDLKYQPWYYDYIDRREVKMLLKGKGTESSLRQQTAGHQQHMPFAPRQPDGAFLVRKSEGGGYTLSFIWEGELKHVRVKTREEKGRTSYTFGNEVWRPTIAELVKYFRNHRLYIANENTHLYLDKPVCKPHEQINEEWYRPDMDRFEAERLLLRVHQEGAFLVRGSSEPGCLSLSFRHKRKISHFQVTKRGKAYVCGSYRFLSLPKMVQYFQRKPLYRKTKLTVAATESIAESVEDEDCGLYSELVYNDPSEIEKCKKVSVRALYDFMGHESENEMSFARGAIITNVREEDKAWWKGDYMDQKQKTFPASYVQVIREDTDVTRRSSDSDSIKNREDTLELRDCKLDNGPYVENNRTLYCFRLYHPRYPQPLQLGCESLLQLEEWVHAIRDGQSRVDVMHLEQQKQEKNQKRARELSDLVVYFQSTTFDTYGAKRHYHVSSIVEDRVSLNDDSLLKSSRIQFLRSYPKGSRIKSSNYDPVSMWTCGVQMVALNYQTPDLAMQVNQARFLTNGRCGYVLKPSFLRDPRFSLNDVQNLKVPSEALVLTITVIAGRNLCSEGRMMGVVRPFVVAEVIGLPLDNTKQRTKAVDEDNGLNPAWSEGALKFDVSCPELAFLRFEVLSEVNDSKTTIAQGTFPVTGLRPGYRSVPLRNCYSELLDMSSLLVHIDIKRPKDTEEEHLFRVIEESRRLRAEILACNTDNRSEHISGELLKTEQKILDYLRSRRESVQSSNGSC